MRKISKAFFLLFHPSSKSFSKITERDETGTYAHSFAAYKRLQFRARAMFCVSVLLVVTASLTFSVYFPFIAGREPRPVMATAVSWDGGGDGSSWSSAGNWSNDAIPDADSDVTINASATVNIAGATTINSLTLDDADSVTPILNFSYDAVGTGAPLVLDAGNLIVDTGATVTHTVGTSVVVGSIYIDVQMGTVTIDGTIDAKSKGFAGGSTASDGSGTGKGIYDSANSGNGGGGGHGGAGGQGNSSGSTGGSTYGNSTTPVTAGSGGGGGYGPNTMGTQGGGIIHINSRGNMAIGGTIQANTASGLALTTSNKKCGGSGAGGSIYLTTEGTMSGTGTLNASAAKGRSCTIETGNTGGGGGGGGYIRREFVASTFSGTVTVAGGAGGDGPSGNGNAGSDGVSSTKTYAVPNTPTVSSPSDGAVDVSLTPTISSSSFSGDITHRQSDWEIDDTEDFSSPIFSSYDDTTNKTTITVSSELSPSTTYYVRTRHGNGAGDSVYSSSTYRFTTIANTATTGNDPVVSSTSDSTLQVVIDESGLPSTTTYAVEVVANETAAYLQADGTLGATAVYQTYTQWGRATGTTITNLSPNTSYAVQIKSKTSSGTISNLGSSVTSVTVAATPQTPIATNVASTSLQLVIPTDNNPATTEYAVSVSSHSLSIGSGDILSATPVWRTREIWDATTLQQLSPNVLHIFQVKARNSVAVETELSPLLALYTLASTIDDPLIQNATRNANGNVDVDMILLQDENSETTEYAIRVTNTDTDVIVYLQEDHALSENIQWQLFDEWVDSENIISIMGLDPKETYAISVLTRNGDGIESEGSPTTFEFSMYRKPKKLKGLRIKQVRSKEVKIRWNDTTRATYYRAQIKKVGQKNSEKWTRYRHITSTSLTVGPLQYSTQYRVRARACNDLGCSKFSAWKEFIILSEYFL